MSLIHLIFERHNDKPFMIHRMTNPDKHWYWQVGSLNGFRNRCLNRRVKRVKLGEGRDGYRAVSCPLSFEVEFEHIHQERRERFSVLVDERWDHVPVQEHETVFDFYRAVGIDWKKDKWPTLEQRQSQTNKGINNA